MVKALWIRYSRNRCPSPSASCCSSGLKRMPESCRLRSECKRRSTPLGNRTCASAVGRSVSRRNECNRETHYGDWRSHWRRASQSHHTTGSPHDFTRNATPHSLPSRLSSPKITLHPGGAPLPPQGARRLRTSAGVLATARGDRLAVLRNWSNDPVFPGRLKDKSLTMAFCFARTDGDPRPEAARSPLESGP